MQDKKNQPDNTSRKDKKNPKKNFFLIIGVILLALLWLYPKNLSQDVSDVNKKLILEDPYKITLYNDFENLLSSGKIDTVYMNDETPNVLFTVKDGTNVKQVDYKTNELRTLKKLESTKKLYKNSKHAIKVYKTFNPGTDDFKKLLLSKNVQVINIPKDSKMQVVYKIISSVISICLYIFLFKIFLFPSTNESTSTKDTNIPDIKFSDIAGNAEAKEEMQFLVDFLKDPKKYNTMGAVMPKGILFYGPPGTGKTLLAKAIAGEAGVPFYERSGTDFIDKYVGVGAQRIKSLFNVASKNQPCIIFIDEIDSIGGIRGKDNVREFDNILNQLLVEMDGFNSNDGVIVIAATNRLDCLDPGLTRPGRFDRHIAIELPDIADRECLLELYLKDKPIDDSVNIKEMAGLCYGFSGAAIKSFVNDAALVAIQNGRDYICKSDLDEAFVKLTLGAHPKRVNSDNINRTKLTAYHEAGHALIIKLFTDDNFHKVTIVGTSNGVGGFAAYTPKEEGYYSKEDLFNKIRVAYGGRAAEYLLFNRDESKVTTSASGDLKTVSNILDYMVNEVGMYEDMLFTLSSKDQSRDDVISYKKDTATMLYEETIQCLDANRCLLDEVAKALMEKETLSNSELDEIINNFDIVYTESMVNR